MKRIALIADTHGNPLALDAVLADLQRQSVDVVVCLGDMVPGPFPAETVERLRTRPWRQIMGDAEATILFGEARLATPLRDPKRLGSRLTLQPGSGPSYILLIVRFSPHFSGRLTSS
jgi:hypothetical protein